VEVKILCLVCGSEKIKRLFVARDTWLNVPGEFSVVKCLDCGVVHINPQPSREELGRYYTDDYPHFAKALGKRPGSEEEFIQPYLVRVQRLSKLAKMGTVLDVGCGDGYFLKAMAEAGWRTKGVEPNEKVSDFARRQLGLDIFTGELGEASFDKESFDMVTMWGVLQVVSQPKQVLMETSRILKKDGVLALAVPNIGSLEASVLKEKWYLLGAPRNLFSFNPLSLRRLLEDTGFAIVETHYNSPYWAFARSLVLVSGWTGKLAASPVVEFLYKGYSKTLGQTRFGSGMEVYCRKVR